MTEPVIFSIVGAGEDGSGDARSNSTIKLFNQWARILTRMGVVSFVATETGQPVEWLTHHADYLAWDEVQGWIADKRPFKLVTAGWEGVDVWAAAEDLDQRLYVYVPQAPQNGEIGFYNTNMGLIREIAVPNRYIQAWFMTTFRIRPDLVTVPTDCTVFYPDPEVRKAHKIGFFHSPSAPMQLDFLGKALNQRGITHEFVLCKLDEDEVADNLRQCGVFLGIQPGHHDLWGSGYAVTHQEAMACGCVTVAFDLLGNREYIIPGQNGVLAEAGNIGQIANVLINLYANPPVQTQLGQAAAYSIRTHCSIPAAVPSLLAWLDLTEVLQYGMPNL